MKREAVEASINGLKESGINFIAILPDSDWAEVQRTAMNDQSFQCVSVSNEAIGVGVCAGAWWVEKSQPCSSLPQGSWLLPFR
jgi:sulfopyruvate decarboxylase TPP-binding subunit